MKHWIIMGGLSGCLPSHCDAVRTKADALDVFKSYYYYDEDYQTGALSDLRRDHITYRVSGNEYVSIEPCYCQEPWIHSEEDTRGNWQD